MSGTADFENIIPARATQVLRDGKPYVEHFDRHISECEAEIRKLENMTCEELETKPEPIFSMQLSIDKHNEKLAFLASVSPSTISNHEFVEAATKFYNNELAYCEKLEKAEPLPARTKSERIESLINMIEQTRKDKAEYMQEWDEASLWVENLKRDIEEGNAMKSHRGNYKWHRSPYNSGVFIGVDFANDKKTIVHKPHNDFYYSINPTRTQATLVEAIKYFG